MVNKMKALICNFNLYDLHQRITLVENNDTHDVAICTLDNIGTEMANMCNRYDVNHVHLYGPAVYAEKLVRDIIKQNKLLYSNRAIDIEVN